MPFTTLTLIVAIGASYLRGGRMTNIAAAELRWTPLLFGGLGLQLLTARLAGMGARGLGLVLVSQALVLVWVGANWARPGMILVLVGLLLNAAVIVANGAMPVSPEAIRAIGLDGALVPPGRHMLLAADTRLALLADRIPLPPLRTIISIGDVVLAAGMIPLLHELMTARTPAERRGGRRGAALAVSGRSGHAPQEQTLDAIFADPPRRGGE